MRKGVKTEFSKETDLCAAFIADATKSKAWTAYPETGGFDILLVRKSDGIQIGIEAKLKLNAKVIEQALPRWLDIDFGARGPDYRAVLVPFDASGGLSALCAAIGITVIRQSTIRYGRPFLPDLPDESRSYWTQRGWHQWCPLMRCQVPDYIPDVSAGASAPLALTDWKIKAIKMSILLSRRPVTRADFKALGLSPQRWTDPWTGWLIRTPDGYIPGPGLPDFRTLHPKNYAEIEADFKTSAPNPVSLQGSLFIGGAR